MGDNLRDFSENFAGRPADFGAAKADSAKNDFGSKYIVMPNPMYGEWERAMYNNSYKKSWKQKDSLRHAVLRLEK
jgi:predicted secreted acid phosphatase